MKKPRAPKKFRFLYLHRWIIENYKPCRVADIGGGKGLLTYLLQNSGFNTTVIDPFFQTLPEKYKDLEKIKHKIKDNESVKRISKEFSPEMAQDYDLLIGLHAHGCNMMIIDAAKKYGKDFILLPCCVIDEPIEKREGVNWRESLIEYAIAKDIDVKTDRLNVMGKDILIYTKSPQNFT